MKLRIHCLFRKRHFRRPFHDAVVLLLGQYSVGKTSFIRYIIGRDFPGARIGPEPTTDRFNAVMWGPEDRVIPGNALAVDQDMPFSSLTKFGTSFLEKFQASLCNSSVLGTETCFVFLLMRSSVQLSVLLLLM